jgi:hypothetical protein
MQVWLDSAFVAVVELVVEIQLFILNQGQQVFV